MQQWQQIEFYIESKNYSLIEDFLFDNQACSVTQQKKNTQSLVTVLFEDCFDVQTIINLLKTQFTKQIVSEIIYKIIKDQEWTTAWLDDYEPIEISQKMVIYPSWRKLPEDSTKIYIKVDPSVAFGCGNHETTKMCLEWIEENITTDSKLLDYGCGTGILAIAAALLGGKYAEGVDVDPKSIESSKINAEMNNVANITKFDYEVSNSNFDLLVANIFSNVLISLVDTMLSKLKIGSKIALSGILQEQVHDVEEAFKQKGVIFNKPRNLGQWYLLTGVKHGL